MTTWGNWHEAGSAGFYRQEITEEYTRHPNWQWLDSDLLDEMTKLAARTETLFEAIAHGDEVHRAWLKEAIENHFAGLPVPPPRSSGGQK